MATTEVSTFDNYGGLYVTGNTTAESSTTSTPAKIAAWDTAMPAGANATVSTSNNNITVTHAGDYFIAGHLSFSGTNGDTINVEIYKDSTATGLKLERTLGNNSVGAASVAGIVTLTAGQAISLYQYSDSTNAITITDAQLSVIGLS